MNENQTFTNPMNNGEPQPPKTPSPATKAISIVVIIVSLCVIIYALTLNTITMSEYNKIRNGMSYSDVCDIVGGEGELGAESAVGEYSAEVYTFKGVLYHLTGANASVSFSNGRVSGKAQVGLIF